MPTLTTKSIKDYLPFYMGCDVLGRPYAGLPNDEKERFEVRGNLIGITPGVLHCQFKDINGYKWDEVTRLPIVDVKLVLRNLSDMTEEEAKELCQYDKLCAEYGDDVTIMKDLSLGDVLTGLTIVYKLKIEDRIIPKIWKLSFAALNAHDFRWLLSKQFDLFSLIPEGLAIDKQTLKQ